MNRIWKEFIFFTVAPMLIPCIFVIPKNEISISAQFVIFSIITALYFIKAYNYFKKWSLEDKIEFKNKIFRVAYSKAYTLSDKKKTYIIGSTYDKDYKVPKEMIPYDVHNYISDICENFKSTISEITEISAEHISVTFIYHYSFKDANEEDKNWRWVVGKETSTHTPLNEFVNQNQESLYYYLMNNKRLNCIFYNDKRTLNEENHYYMSARDMDHKKIGSVFAVKVDFNNNAVDFIEGILLISTYGKRFIENEKNGMTETELRNILFEDLFPYYRRLLEAELGMLYLKHNKS